jgi:tetratricopeptide (TPR) repeat protein
MLRNFAPSLIRKHRHCHSIISQTFNPTVFGGKRNVLKATGYRQISNGIIIDAIEAPAKCLLQELQQKISSHQQLVASSADKKSSDIKKSLESILKRQTQLRMWEDCVKTEKELFDTFYAHESLTDIAESYSRLGKIYCNMKYFTDSIKYLEKALSCWQQIHVNMFHAKVGDAWYNLAMVRSDELDLMKATKCLAMAEPHFRHHKTSMIDIGRSSIIIDDDDDNDNPKSSPLPHVNLRKVLEQQAFLLRLQGLHVDALKIYREIESIWGRDRDSSLDIADCSMVLEDFRESEKLYDKVWDMLNPEDPDDVDIRSCVLHQKGLIHLQTNDPRQALTCFEQAYKIRKKNYGEFYPLVGTTVNLMGVAHATIDQPSIALNYFHEALMIARRNSDYSTSDKDPLVQNLLRNIQMVKKRVDENSNLTMS